MAKRYKDKKHLEYVASLPCFICKAGFFTHSDTVQAHHLLKGYETDRGINGRGMSLRNGDDQVIPLCYMHHHKLHTKFGSEKKFFEHYGMSADAGKKYAKHLFENKADLYDDNDDLPF